MWVGYNEKWVVLRITKQELHYFKSLSIEVYWLKIFSKQLRPLRLEPEISPSNGSLRIRVIDIGVNS